MCMIILVRMMFLKLKAVGPVKDECPGKGSPGKNRDIFMVLISTATVATFHGRELSSKITCPKNL